ncbi:hypothetical protein QFZ55_000801 [Streptomyces luteogriseus]|nr:hypothetical protein [Streptomyces luteogriseus]
MPGTGASNGTEQGVPRLLELAHALTLQGLYDAGVRVPRSSTASRSARACSYVPTTVLPVISPWSATAFRVASGMVFTVFGATSSVTYIVSL